MNVEIAYAKPDEQVVLALDIEGGATIEEVIQRSGILERFPEIDLKKNKVGVFGKAARLDRVLEEGDRVEIYRPLIADPKEARKRRAAKGKAMKKGAGSTTTG
ncbi:MAG TPA: RnfH family protein [Chromatiales bacterium]|nr:RnfH family protein [Chromatiales bacterium]